VAFSIGKEYLDDTSEPKPMSRVLTIGKKLAKNEKKMAKK
jgi:hypothetical protein